jgi:hypothetical protein
MRKSHGLGLIVMVAVVVLRMRTVSGGTSWYMLWKLWELGEQAWLKDLQGDSFRLSPHSATKMFMLPLDVLLK